MRKILAFILLLPLFSLKLLAFEADSPASPSIIKDGFLTSSGAWGSIRTGYEGDFILNARMEKNGFGRVDSFKYDSNSGVAVLNLMKRLDIFGIFGAGHVKANWRIEPEANSFSRIEIETKNSFAWSIKAKAILFEWGNTSLGFGGRYGSCRPALSWMTKNGELLDSSGASLHFKEWQVDLGVAHKIDFFTPYVSAKYSRATAFLFTQQSEAVSDSGLPSLKMHNRQRFGAVIGCDLSNGKIFRLNLEARLFDEEALSASAEFRF